MLFSVVFGCFFGFVYDIIRVGRKLLGYDGKSRLGRAVSSVILVHLSDIIYILLLAVSFCIFLFYFNSGRFRWYFLFSLIAGYFCYDFSIGKLVRMILYQLVKLFRSVFKLLILCPLKKFISLMRLAFSPIQAFVAFRSRLRLTEKEKTRYIKELEI